MSLRSAFFYKHDFVPWEQPRSEGTQHLYELLASYDASTPDGKKKRVLDLGCGRGLHAVKLAQLGWDVTGIELIDIAADAARQRAQKHQVEVTIIQGDVAKVLSQLQGEYDLIIDIGCLHMLPKYKRKQVAEQLDRLMKPGAGLLLSAFSLPISFGGNVTAQKLERLFFNWQITRVERARVSDLPFFIRFFAPNFFQLTKNHPK